MLRRDACAGVYMSLADESVRLAERLPAGLLRNIVARLDPQRVIVFGSQAAGKADEDSDWDVLIVVDDDTPRERANWRTMGAIRREVDAALDFLVYPASMFRKNADMFGTLAWTAANDGVVVYERR
jgi:uncharacterized protein